MKVQAALKVLDQLVQDKISVYHGAWLFWAAGSRDYWIVRDVKKRKRLLDALQTIKDALNAKA